MPAVNSNKLLTITSGQPDPLHLQDSGDVRAVPCKHVHVLSNSATATMYPVLVIVMCHSSMRAAASMVLSYDAHADIQGWYVELR
jgi:hypothetical protein